MPVTSSDQPIASFVESLPDVRNLRETTTPRACEYRGYRELLQAWSTLKNARSQMIGRSRNGQPLWMVEIGNPKAANVSVVIAGIHPIEWIGVETAFQIAQEHNLEPCPDRRICFFPLVNPDGFRKVETSLRNGTRKWVRTNDAGVDLNRNWPTHHKASRGGLREKLKGAHQAGPRPLSEPEVASVVHTLDKIAETASIDVALSLHSIGKMILLPWGGIWRAPEAEKRHQDAARVLRKRIGGYTIKQVSHWIPGLSFAHGMEIDHLHQAYGATSILIECTRGELDTFRPSVLLDPFRIFNPKRGRAEGFRIAQAVNPFVRGDL